MSINHVTVYGIANCDTMKKARKWLDKNTIDHDFHDYKKKGIDRQTLQIWCNELGWEALINRRGTTWRKLEASDKEDLDETRAIDLMIRHTSIIKRPVLQYGDSFLLGFDEASYESALL